LKGEAEIRASLGKRFKNADEFIEYLEKYITLQDITLKIKREFFENLTVSAFCLNSVQFCLVSIA